MRKDFTLILFLAFLWQVPSFGQLDPGATAPDWTLVDLDGNTHNLYSILNSGKTVYITISATWCGPCWSFHNSGAMEDIWSDFGPSGSDEAMVFFIEGDLNTPEACLYGNGPQCNNSQGNWVNGITYPIINLTSQNGPNVPSDYQLSYYPTVYAICPDKRVYETGQASATVLESYMQSCDMDITNVAVTDESCFGIEDGIVDIDIVPGAGNISYNWSNGDRTEDLQGVGQGTYSLIMRDQNGVELTTQATVSGPSSAVEIEEVEVDDYVTCNGDADATIDLTVSGGNSSSGYTALWNDGATSLTRTSLSPGTYTVTITDGDNCTDIESYTVNDPEVMEAASTSEDEFCEQENGTITVSAEGGVGLYTYDIGEGPQTSNFFDNLITGIYDVTVTDELGCQTFDEIEVGFVEGPLAFGPSTVELNCNSSVYTMIDASISVVDGNTQIQWSTTDGVIESGANELICEVSSVGTYTLTLSNDAIGCSDQITVEVLPNPNVPEAVAQASGELSCDSQQVTLSSTGSSTGTDITYTWYNSANQLVGQGVSITVDLPGQYRLEVRDTTAQCSDETMVEVQGNNDLPQVMLEGMPLISCLNSEATLTANISQGGTNPTVVWFDANGNQVFTGPTFITNIPGEYSVQVTNEDTDCQTLTPFTIADDTEDPEVIIDEADYLSCTSSTVVLDATSSSQGSDFVYVWRTVDGVIDSGDSSLQPTVSATGTYTLSILNQSNGCSAEKEVTVSAYDVAPDISGQSITLNARTIEVDATVMGVTTGVLWDFGDGTTSTDLMTSHTYDQDGIYELCLTVTNDCGSDQWCEMQNVGSSTILSVSDSITHVSCHGGADGSISLHVVGGEPPYQYSWNTGDTTSSLSQLEAGGYAVTITDSDTSDLVLQINVSSPDALQVDNLIITNTDPSANNGRIQVDVIGGTRPYTYLWSNGSTDKDLMNVPAGDYSLVVTDANNCQENFGPFTVELSSSVSTLQNIDWVKVGPNPFQDQILIEWTSSHPEPMIIHISDLSGKVVLEKLVDSTSHYREILPLPHLYKGVYVIQFMNESGSHSMKLIKQ